MSCGNRLTEGRRPSTNDPPTRRSISAFVRGAGAVREEPGVHGREVRFPPQVRGEGSRRPVAGCRAARVRLAPPGDAPLSTLARRTGGSRLAAARCGRRAEKCDAQVVRTVRSVSRRLSPARTSKTAVRRRRRRPKVHRLQRLQGVATSGAWRGTGPTLRPPKSRTKMKSRRSTSPNEARAGRCPKTSAPGSSWCDSSRASSQRQQLPGTIWQDHGLTFKSTGRCGTMTCNPTTRS